MSIMQDKSVTLYRKYRPQSFDDLLGQDEIVKILKNAVKGAPAHAYLFSGTRGVGKTSTARIFAKELGVSEKDLYELDAASNRKIDDFRELNDSIYTLPVESKYKLYIIDEVHMLTKEAFNAFLKSLEEPPSHVVFILATTNPEKVPETILSRCQVLNFKQASFEDLKKLLKDISVKESFKVPDSVIDYVAQLANGSYRDALGLLQSVFAGAKGKVVDESAAEHLFASGEKLLFEILDALRKKDLPKILEKIKQAEEANYDMKIFADSLLDKLRMVLLIRYGREKDEIKKMLAKENYEIMKKTALEAKNVNSATIKNLLEKISLMEYANKKAIALELFAIDELDKK